MNIKRITIFWYVSQTMNKPKRRGIGFVMLTEISNDSNRRNEINFPWNSVQSLLHLFFVLFFEMIWLSCLISLVLKSLHWVTHFRKIENLCPICVMEFEKWRWRKTHLAFSGWFNDETVLSFYAKNIFWNNTTTSIPILM